MCMRGIHEHVTVRVIVRPDDATKPPVLAEVIADLPVQGRFFRFQADGVELEQNHADQRR